MTLDVIQIGVTATRTADGGFEPAVPLYIERTPGTERSLAGLVEDIGKLLAQRMRRYAEETGQDL